MFSSTLVVLSLAAATMAVPFITSPTAAMTFSGGKPASINWQDDGKAPSLKDFGISRVSIYAGNAQQQTSLQLITDNVDVSTTSSIQFTPNAQIGPNSGEYFIRIESVNFKDPAQPQFPALAFSAKFKMDNMSGQFSPAVQAQINGQSTAPLASQPTSAPGASGSSSSASPTSSASSAPASRASASPSASASANSNGAASVGVSSAKFLAAILAVAAVALF
ncbi:hypothetical protein HGRIS_012458 [Hohenbuehelia grisea]|uniref:Yeast cell wall synthesis Kre9/Knh1-like N-terminal domain-containing protein n=1 Tax=Hohenbuehelia grisea TaxID=104357 RepID=A0ABR3ISE3_9AGAR